MDRLNAASYRKLIEDMEAAYPDGSLAQSLNSYFRVNAHVVIPFMADIARTPAILDAVQSILGPDLLVWSAEL
ncbi:MAG: hypothetical protein WBD37_01945, partial [Anderseniella sp.]